MGRDQTSERVLNVLQARAHALAQPQSNPDEDAAEQLVFTVGGTRLAVPLARVVEVLPPGSTTSLPGGRRALTGVRVVHGELIVVADAGPLLGIDQPGPAAARYAVVLDGGSPPVGLLTDLVDGVVGEEPDARPPAGAGLVASVTSEGVLVLDVDALLADPRLTTASSSPADDPDSNEGAM